MKTAKRDSQGYTFMELLSLAEKWGWDESGRRTFEGKRYCLFNEVLSKSEADAYAKKLRGIGYLARAVPQKPKDVGGMKGRYAVYYWYDRRKIEH